ncbi:MAG TPA: hypothetical protein ENN22_03740 [bacterium]|nr:hypothetical protein [bacterium]
MAVKKGLLGVVLGVVAGIIDVIPMIFQGLSWDANLSAFSMWVVVGFFIAVIDFKINPILKGIIIAFLVLLPSAIIIGWNDPFALIPIAIMTTLLGALLGFTVDRLTKKMNQ